MSECCICLVELENTSIIKLDCCNNYIHTICNDNLINNKINRCPLCRCKLDYVIIEMESNLQNRELINYNIPFYKLAIVIFVIIFIITIGFWGSMMLLKK